MTEEEAKTKWCPMVRSTGWGNDQMGNRDHKGGWTGGDCCVASECMMWRWALEPDPNFKPTHRMMDTYPRNPATDPNPWMASTTNGYCGLAGRL
jgi:hypothetical protein